MVDTAHLDKVKLLTTDTPNQTGCPQQALDRASRAAVSAKSAMGDATGTHIPPGSEAAPPPSWNLLNDIPLVYDDWESSQGQVAISQAVSEEQRMLKT